MNWDEVCKPMDLGGLGIIDLHIQNQCLIQKFLILLLQQPTTSWQCWFQQQYGPNSGRDLGDIRAADTATWKQLAGELPAFRELTRVQVGNGLFTSFWMDLWDGNQALAADYPALYSHCMRENISVSSAFKGGNLNR